MTTIAATRKPASLPAVRAWLPCVVLPVTAGLLLVDRPPWVFMWALALTLFAGLKWLTFADSSKARRASWRRAAGYLFLWPGMDAEAFFDTAFFDTAFFDTATNVRPAAARQWWRALANIALGLVLVYAVAPPVLKEYPWTAGWIAVVGIVLVLHFGLFHLLALAWRRGGVDARPIMNAPLGATSLSDFWGQRWNAAFRDAAHRYVFRPCVGRLGVAGATMAVFFVSGVVHDVVISIPARGGWGLPTLYFALQGGGLLLERSRIGKRLGLGRGLRGRLFAAAVTLAPLGMLFHGAFVLRVIVPMLRVLTAN